MARKRSRPEADIRLARGRARPEARFPVAPARTALPQDYADALAAIKSRIQQERLRVVLSANAAMVLLYWDIGRMILARQESAGWGAKVIDRLAADLREAFPDMKGFSPRNLKYMRAFAAAWPERAIVQEPLARLPWYHHIALLEKLDDPAERLWYARQAIERGWSHNILVLQIQGRARDRQGKALTNFAAALPPGESDLAAQVFKDPYLFDFLGTADPRREREVEEALVDHVQRFLLELGSGFAFVGRQVLLEVGDQDFLVDPALLPLEAALLRGGRAEGRGVRPGIRGEAESLSLGGRRPAAPSGRQAHHRAAALPLEERGRGGVRAARPQEADRRVTVGDEPRQVAAEGTGGDPADGGGDRGRAFRRIARDATRSPEEAVSRAQATKPGGAVAANVKERGYGG